MSRSAKRPWLLPLVPLWAAGTWVQGWLLLVGVRRVRRLKGPVVSVGSLSAGGAGKTPVVMAMAALLEREGFAVDVLSRGYKRASGGVEKVDAAGEARRFGDEPLEMAQAGLRVFVGADRYAAGLVSEAAMMGEHGRQVHLLDDGFQHRQLGRNMDVVLVTAEDVRDRLLPAGNLREGLSALERADVVVVREEELAEVFPYLEAMGRERIWLVRRELVLPEEIPRRPLAFCGIARPNGFFKMLRAAGVGALATRVFGDHHAYDAADLEQLAESAAGAGADGFVTTAKDAVKLTAAGRARLERVGPVAVAGLRVVWVEEAQVVRHLRKMMLESVRARRETMGA